MANLEDSEFISSHKHTKTPSYGTTIIENDMKTSGTDFLQLRI